MGYLRGDGVELILCKESAISYPLHNHVSVFTLGLVLEGEIEVATDKGSGIYWKKGLFVIPPYVPHSITARSRYTLLSLCVNKELLTTPDFERAISGVSAFLRRSIDQQEVEQRLLQALRVLALAGRMIPAERNTALSGLKRRLERYPEQKYGIDDMAGLAYASKYHLIRAFKREVGLTPHQFQIQNRVRKAQRMLMGPATITEVALATGFCDQSHFIRQFEKIVGLTPTDYRLACTIAAPISIG